MYIKYVRINGFKSYRDKVQCGPLSPMHNSVVGLNGSGKSNFFAALRFVLSDAYSNMRPEERAKLLNEGAGASLVSAYVEIVFDNSDHRLESDKEEVTIRRQIGLKKDEYFVDSKHVNKQDISQMLETAGFSKSNPYYIVEQGKVTKITEMTDKQRLELLKEIAGTNVYEEKKEESLKIMKESDAKMAEIKKNLDMIEERLAKLDAEKEELSQYYQLDKDRRSLQHALLAQKIKGLHEELTSIERERTDLKVDSTENDTQRHALEKERQDLEMRLDALQKQASRLEAECQDLEKEEEDRIKAVYEEQAKVTQIQRALKGEEQALAVKSAKISKLHKEIQSAQSKLDATDPNVAHLANELEIATQRYQDVDRELEKLAAIQGNATRFKSKAQRDADLQEKIKSQEALISRRKRDAEKVKEDIAACEKATEESDATINSVRAEAAARKEDIKRKSQALTEVEKKSLETQTQIKDVQRSLAKLQMEKDNAEFSITHSKEQMQQSMPGMSAKALRFLSKYVEEKNIRGYYGPVISLFDCNERFYTAVEQAGGARLYNAVVEDEKVASQLVKALMESKQGRMQFLPLNKLRPEVPQFPQDNANAQPVVKCLKYDAKFEPAIQEVFGKTLLCENLEAATGYRRSHNLACVTLDGDKIAKKGAIKGGYYDTSASKIKLNKAVRVEEETVREKEREMQKLHEKERQLDAANTRLMGEKSKLTVEMKSAQDGSGADARKMQRERERMEMEREQSRGLQNQLKTLETDIKDLEYTIAGLQDQLQSSFEQALTPEQQRTMEQLTQQNTQLRRERTKQEKDLAQAQRTKAQLENDILVKQQELEALEADLDSMRGNASSELEVESERLKSAQSESAACAARKSAKEEELRAARSEMHMCADKLKKQKDYLRKQAKDVEEARKRLDQLQDKKNRLITEMDHAQSQQRDLGSLPESFEKYKNKGQKALHDELHKVTEKLKKFKDVNKKALDQFNQFTEQREKFKLRKEELEQGAGSIRDLIRKLDEKKDDAIQTNFRMVARNFSEVFKQIVPGGSGELIMKTSEKERDDDDDELGDGAAARPASALRKYVGVAVKVRFQAGGEVRVMRTLSGGQKSVVALGIIFAIQQCDPAPFYLFDEVDANLDPYLFDEVDANLDPMYRAAVAAMISSQKAGDGKDADTTVQFITSSFQPELVQVADCHWLTNHHGMSRIVQGTLDDSLTVLREAQKSANVVAPGHK